MDNYKINVGYKYNDSFTENDFIEAVINNIRDDINGPSYIFDEMSLSKVFRINVPIFLSSGDSTINYSRMIGFDKIITTTKYKTTTYGSGVQNRTQSTSSKTVTDWKQDSGTITGSATSGIYHEEYMIYDEYITNHVMDKNNVSNLSSDELSQYYLTEDEINYLENDILEKVYRNNITNYGDHVKNEEYYGETRLYNITCTIVSLYAVEITLRDRTIHFIASSNGDIELKQFGDYPADDYENLFKFNKEISAQRREATKKPRALAKCSLLSSIVIFIVLLALGVKLDNIALKTISIIVLVLGLVLLMKFMADIKRISKPYYEQIQDNNMREFNEKQRIKEEGYHNYIRNN